MKRAASKVQGVGSRKRAARRLAVAVADAVNESGKTTVLVTSTTPGAGKSLLVELIEPELDRFAPNRFRVLGTNALSGLGPWSRPADGVLLVDGPSVLDPEGLTNLGRGWIAAFDGALIVVVGRETRREDLAETVAFLHAAKIPIIGIVWNDVVCPPLQDRVREFAERVSSLFRIPSRRRDGQRGAAPRASPSAALPSLEVSATESDK